MRENVLPTSLGIRRRVSRLTAIIVTNANGTLNAAGKNLFKLGAGTLSIPQTALNSVSVNAGTLKLTGGGNTVVRGVTIDTGATLDLTNGALIIDYDEGFSPRDTVKASIAAGRITSSTLGGAGRVVGFVVLLAKRNRTSARPERYKSEASRDREHPHGTTPLGYYCPKM